MMTELVARNLSPKEIAELMRYHDDPGVRRLAAIVLDFTEHESPVSAEPVMS